jgi:hypothetical protein
MSYFQRIAEQKIQEAIRNGEFDNLEGSGKPLDHSDYFSAPPELRMSYHLLKNAGIVPEEVELLNSIHRITRHIKSTLTSDEKERLTREKILLQNKYNMLREQRALRGPNL